MPVNDYEYDQSWARRFIPEMKIIMAQVLISEAPYDEDTQHNTDLIILRGTDQTRVACRVRRFAQYARFHTEFTIRASRPNGVTTELEKLISGWGRYLLYGFADAANSGLHAWILGDLNVFRNWYFQHLRTHNGEEPGVPQTNTDGSSTFRAFKLTELPAAFILSRHSPPVTPVPLPTTQRTTTTHLELFRAVEARRMGTVSVQQWLGRWLRPVPLRQRKLSLLTEAQAQEALTLLERGISA